MKAININNVEKITAEIKAAEGRAKERTITAQDIAKALEKIEKHLRITKKDMEGIVADVDIHAQNFPRAYKYRAQSTQFIAERRKAGWYVTLICRCETRREGHETVLTLTDEAKAAIIKANTYF